MLVGREVECLRVDRVLESARRGRSAVLLISGEAGLGKTSLLRYAIERAEAMSVVRATGVEFEAELEFSGLLELCRPLLHYLGDLPDPQARSLRGVLGLEEAQVSDRFGAGAATLGLLAAVAEREPLLVVVDDVQWLDAASADALRFATRRLFADRVAVIVAARHGEGRAFEWPGAEELVVAPLDLSATRMLLEREIGSRVPDAVLAELHAATAGNPLALIELPGVLSPDQLAGREPLEQPLAVGVAVERAFARRAERLPESTRAALLVLALGSVDDVEAVRRGLSSAGLDLEALEPAERETLVAFDEGRVRFLHPLVRSALTRVASPSDRRAGHRALAHAFDSAGDSERRAWHLAAAALGPDEDAASALAEAGARARERSGFAPAAAALERAARLSPAQPHRLERLTDAAECAWRAGATDRAVALLDEALAAHPPPQLQGKLSHLRGRLEIYTGSHDSAYSMFLSGARLVEDVDAPLAAVLFGDAVEACFLVGRVREGLAAATRARELAPCDGTFADVHADYWLARALNCAGRADEAAALFRGLGPRLSEVPDGSRVWALTLESITLGMLDLSGEGYRVGSEAVAVARTEGPTRLASALSQVSWNGVRAGAWERASAAASEGLALARELNQMIHVVEFLSDLTRVEAARGNEHECRTHAAEASALAERHGLTIVSEHIRTSLGLLEFGLGHLEEAVRHLEKTARAVAELGFFDRDISPEADLVEALLHLGRTHGRNGMLRAPIERLERTGPAWGKAQAARAEALVADDHSFEQDFQRALEFHRVVDDAFARARTELAFGERLRRAGRRRDARAQLRLALETFDALDASPWVERAATELRASGETLRKRKPHDSEELTPQELQIALLVADGRTNKEVGAALFLSHKTVEFHLGRIYRKLNLGSRVELARRLAAADVPPHGLSPSTSQSIPTHETSQVHQ
jgi:DNA-binding CsgD family transcriptional regulator